MMKSRNFRISPNPLWLPLFLLCAACGQGVYAEESEVLGATVLLIDHASGQIGVSYIDEKTEREQKKALRLDPDEVFVTDARRRDLDFESVAVGDTVDLYCETDASGAESVTEIVDYSRLSED